MSCDFAPYPLKFHPIAQPRIWGGTKLAAWFGLDADQPIGEVWTLSDHPSAPSICANGPLQGKSLSEIIQLAPQAYLGEAWSVAKGLHRFPLLIKFLHADDDLSVQIHPDDDYAQKREGDFGKTEAWYFLEAEEGAQIVYGHRFANRETFLDAVERGKIKEYLNYLPVKTGDFVFVPARTLHALLKGTVVVEIQQTSDVTYRVYDWDRRDASGKPRQLHIEQAADVLRYDQGELPALRPVPLEETEQLIRQRWVECPYFTIEKINVNGKASLSPEKEQNPEILIVTRGSGQLEANGETLSVKAGDTLLLPARTSSYALEGSLECLRTFY